MKSWAHTYLAGSLLGTALIGAALIAFVALVSLNAPAEWPTPSLGLGGGSDAGVSGAVAVGAAHSANGGLDANPSGGPSVAVGTAVGVAGAQGSEFHSGNGRAGGTETAVPPDEVAVAPASAEVVARNPGPSPPEGVGVVPPPPATASPTEAGGAPAPATSGGEVDGLGETPPAGPIVAGDEEPESQPPEDNGSQPSEDVGSTPPPSGGSTEGGDAVGSPGQDELGEEAQSESGDAPVGPALDLEPGALRSEVANWGVADLALAPPRLVDVTADR